MAAPGLSIVKIIKGASALSLKPLENSVNGGEEGIRTLERFTEVLGNFSTVSNILFVSL